MANMMKWVHISNEFELEERAVQEGNAYLRLINRTATLR